MVKGLIWSIMQLSCGILTFSNTEPSAISIFYYAYVIFIMPPWQARSQDLEKGGGGLFWKSEKCANDLDSNFHWSWISFRRFVRKLRRKCLGKHENSKVYSARNWVISKKKKKKVFAKIENDFSIEIRNSKVFSAQNQVISQKKRSTPKLRVIFRPISQIHTFEGGCFRMGGGGYFPFFTENRPQKHKKHAILHTSQANGGGSSPPPPPLATLLLLGQERAKRILRSSCQFSTRTFVHPTRWTFYSVW